MYLLNPGDGRDVQSFTIFVEAINALHAAKKIDVFATLYLVKREGRGFKLLRYTDGSFYMDDGHWPIKVIDAAQRFIRERAVR